MSDLARKYEDGGYSYNEYLEIDDGKRYEVIDGELYMMSSPSSIHQMIVMEMSRQIGNALYGKACTPFIAPMDVRLFYKEDGSDDIIVQPDIFVVCDRNKIGKNSINGAPDFVIEIVSPGNTAIEMSLKQLHYERSGVKEYWLIDYENKNLLKFVSSVGVFVGEKCKLAGIISTAYLGIDIDFDSINIIGA
jgi:Uma2 family endonuclease